MIGPTYDLNDPSAPASVKQAATISRNDLLNEAFDPDVDPIIIALSNGDIIIGTVLALTAYRKYSDLLGLDAALDKPHCGSPNCCNG